MTPGFDGFIQSALASSGVEAIRLRQEPLSSLLVSCGKGPMRPEFCKPDGVWKTDVHALSWDGKQDIFASIFQDTGEIFHPEVIGLYDWRSGALRREDLYPAARMDMAALIVFGADALKDRDALAALVKSDLGLMAAPVFAVCPAA